MSTEVMVALIGAGASIVAALIALIGVLVTRKNRDTEPRKPPITKVKTIQLDPASLRHLAINQTNQYVAARKKFSAWEVTLALRAAQPQADIDHGQVRDIVHAHMQTVINDGLYRRTRGHSGSRSFALYVPSP